MDTRNSYLSFDMINADNYLDHIPAIAHALNIDAATLQALVDGDSLANFNQLLDDSHEQSLRSADKSIEDALTPDAVEDSAMHLYYAHKRLHLNELRDQLANHLQLRQSILADQESVATNLVIEQIRGARDCFFGNYARKLDTLKRNTAIALQDAAATLAADVAVKNTPDAFNIVFENLAHIDQDGKLILDQQAQDTFASYSLNELQRVISTTLTRERNSLTTQQSSRSLATLETDRSALLKKGDALLDLHDHHFTFTPVAFEIEQLANHAAKLANNLFHTLESNRQAAIENFDKDSGKLEHNQHIRDEIQLVLAGKPAYRNIITHVKQLTSAIDQDRKEIHGLISRLEDLDALEPSSSRHITESKLAELKISPAMKERIIDGMQEVLQNLHHDFLGRIGLDFKRVHYHALADQLRAAQDVLAQILRDAAKTMPPLTAFSDHCQGIAKRREMLLTSLVGLYEFTEQMEAEYKNMCAAYDKARSDFIEFLTHTQKNDWEDDLLQRLDATLLDINDLSKKYGQHPVFQHTSLRGVITDVLETSRAKTLATKETIEPAFVPPSLQKTSKPSFMQRHPLLKKALFSLLIGVSAAMLATIVAGAVIFTAGAALPAAAVIGILVGSAVGTGVVGTGIGSIIYDKTKSPGCPPPAVAQRQPSSTALSLKALNDSDGHALDGKSIDVDACYDSSDEDRVEVIADYSTEVIFSGDSAGSEPVRLRLT